eukprot:Colp12_sorted_trinity150504_noHs@28364
MVHAVSRASLGSALCRQCTPSPSTNVKYSLLQRLCGIASHRKVSTTTRNDEDDTIEVLTKRPTYIEDKAERVAESMGCTRSVYVEPDHPLDLKKVLVVAKVTRFEFEKLRQPELTEEELGTSLQNKGADMERLRHRYDIHRRNLDKLLAAFRHRHIDYDVRSALEYDETHLEGKDAVFSAGGDGTFLAAAAKIHTQVPVVGINTDPHRSQGFLCAQRGVAGGRTKYAEIVDMILTGQFRYKPRQRIRITLIDGQEQSTLPHLALNDVFISELEPSRSSYYELSVDDGKLDKQKSSGIVVCTGTGSTAWLYNVAKIERDDVKKVLQFANKFTSEEEVDQVTRSFNRSIVFDPAEPIMEYVIREPVVNGIFSITRHRGYAKKLEIKSRSWEAGLVIDGSHTYQFNDGRTAILEILEENALRTVSFAGFRL